MRALQIILLIGALSVCSASDVPAAMFAWGSSDFVVPGPTARRVSYQVRTSVLAYIAKSVISLWGTMPAHTKLTSCA